MEPLDASSTPLVQTGTRRLLRKSSEFLSPLEKNDDETERSRRRSNAANVRRLSQIPSSPAPADSPVVNNTKNLNKQQVLDTLIKWHRMYSENKITKHNVWNLHAVEYMRRYMGMQTDAGNMDVLKFASSALDVSSKVYGMRVDCVYDTSMKLASRINRICAQGDVDATSDGENDNNGEDAEAGQHNNTRSKPKEKKKPKRRVPKTTIAKDDADLFGTFPQVETGLFNTQTNIKNSMVENLFSSRLPISKSGTEMKLMNDECMFRRSSDVDALVTEPLLHKTHPIQLLPKTLPPICPELQKFVIDEWDPDQVEISSRTLDEVVYDKEGFPVPELDASLNTGHNNFENGEGVYIDSDDEHVDGQILTDEMARNRQVAFVVDFNPDNSNMLQANEYSYMSYGGNANRKLSQIWAGPSHWKLKTLKRGVARYTGKQDDNQGNKRARRPKREEEIINFSEDIPDILLTKQLKPRKTVPFAAKEKLFMPLLKPDTISLDRLLTKFANVVSQFKKEERKEDQVENHNSGNADDNIDDDLGEYDHNNLNNSQYCPQNAVEDVDGVEQVDNCANFLENNLVDKPDMVVQSQLTYQVQARKLDMRKLKKAIWEILTNTTNHDDPPAKMHDPVRFRLLLEKLPAKLSTQARTELTCQSVFVALLHLANEHCLALENSDDMLIRQDGP